jgi:hypothetical protein
MNALPLHQALVVFRENLAVNTHTCVHNCSIHTTLTHFLNTVAAATRTGQHDSTIRSQTHKKWLVQKGLIKVFCYCIYMMNQSQHDEQITVRARARYLSLTSFVRVRVLVIYFGVRI